MQATRSRDTSPEIAVRRELHKRGMRFRVALALISGSRRTVDIVFTRAKVAVLIDGCFWHGCPEHHQAPKANAEFWAAKLAGNMLRDHEMTRMLTDAGWIVLRFWEHESVEEVANAIQVAVLKARTQT